MYEFLRQSRKETVVFKGDEDTFESLFDKLVSFASAKHIFEIGQRISSYWYEEGEKDPHAMEEQGRQVEVGHGQACHLLGLWEHLSHESRLFPQQRLDQRQRKSPAKLRKMAEVVTSLKMAPPAKVTSQVRRAKRKAHARTKACFQLKVILGVNSSGKRIGSGNWHVISGRSFNGIQVQTIGETTTDSSKPAIFGTLDIPPVLGNTEASLLLQYDGQAWVKFNDDMGATTTALPWEICSSFSCVRCANSSLRKARTCPTSVEPSFRVWQQTQRGRTRPQSTHTTCICKRNQQVPRRVHLRGIWRAHSQTQPSFRRSTTRVPSVVVASWLSWNSSSVSRRKIAHLILETSEQIGDGSSGIDSGPRGEWTSQILHLRRETSGRLSSREVGRERRSADPKSGCTS